MVDQLTAKDYQTLVAPRPHLWWGAADKTRLSPESVVEGILGRGNWNDVNVLFKEWGIHEVKRIFEKQMNRSRTNYRAQTLHFFRLYFNRHA